MRLYAGITVAALLMLGACTSQDNPVDQYGTGLIQAHSAGKVAGQEADMNAVKTAIAAYYASNERYPADLAEVSRLIRMELSPGQYAYNPATGLVTLK